MDTKWDQGISFILSFCYYDHFRLWRLKRIEPLSLTFSIFFILRIEMKESIIAPKYAVHKKISFLAEFSGVEVQHETKKMKVWASSIEYLPFFSSQLVFCVHRRPTLIRGFPMEFVSLLCVRPLSRRNFSAAHVMVLPIVINLFLPCALLKFVHVTRQSRRSFRKKNSGSIPFTGLVGERTWFSWF